MSTLSITLSNSITSEAFPKSDPTPALDLLFSRGKQSSMSSSSILDYWIKKLIQHQPGEVPITTLLAKADPKLFNCPYYLCCELVKYTAGMNDVYVRRLSDIDLITSQSEHYRKLLCEIFEGAVIRHISTWPSLFILGFENHPNISTINADNAELRPMSDVLPEGPQAKFWISKMNETQMVFHQSNENIASKDTAQRPNGVWLWGEGSRLELPNSPLVVSGQSPELLTLARAANATVTSYEYIFTTKPTPPEALIEIQISEDPKSLIQANLIASKALSLLRTGQYSELNIQTMKNSVIQNTKCTKYSLHKFWKKTTSALDWLTNNNE